MFVFTRKLLHLEDANVRLDSEKKNPELGWLIWLPPVFFQGCIHIYIPTGDVLHLFKDKSCEFSVEFIIWMSKVHRPLNQVLSELICFHKYIKQDLNILCQARKKKSA